MEQAFSFSFFLALLPIPINFAHSKLMYNFSSPCTVEDSTQVLRGIFFSPHLAKWAIDQKWFNTIFKG